MAGSLRETKQSSDDIDLIEIIRVLWDKKVWIILTTFITTLLAGIYAFTAKEQWTSKATVIAPKLTELGEYLSVRREYNRILRVDPIDPNALSARLFNNFNRLAQSQDTKNEFFIASNVYKKLVEGKEDREQRAVLFKLSNENTSFIIPDAKKDPNAIGRTVSFSAETPIEAQDTLGELIQYINHRAFAIELDDFLVDFQNVLTSLQYEKSLIQEDLSVNKSIQLENLNKAYETAQKAGVKEYSKVFNQSDTANIAAALSDTKIPLSDSKLADGSYLFMLGEKYLKAQIDVASEKGIVYPPRYYQIDYQIEQLEPLLEKAKTVKTKAYRYQASPDYPINKDKPKTVIILLLGVIAGGVLGCLFVLFNSLVSKEKANK
ncbi:O-antigen chain length determining protein [Mannheimia sp. USDA-ARS-USMARC-1261]|uniref:LPS O-antigen chain length determinant protein WzzB n=1 Tax=Mannheimia sp. USDA-ARS-USMARC-1261 TaxID=1432056 RepID=UPI0003E32613|nr:Wzz/FepE/Etk N-terminal domain-containing protein [Mannheimia sp. USDA-ARS-USMARC-1261]AHG74149.1 O-antigen chain length determining protein [Mannheimia sp. USDA-ARS-USMARC-1261]